MRINSVGPRLSRRKDDNGIEVSVIQFFQIFPDGASDNQMIAYDRALRRAKKQAIYDYVAQQYAKNLYRNLELDKLFGG